LNLNPPKGKTMPRTLYSPRLSDDVVRALYREGQRQRKPMTHLADELLRRSLAETSEIVPLHSVADNIVPFRVRTSPGAA
jgi:hypothetical protein